MEPQSYNPAVTNLPNIPEGIQVQSTTPVLDSLPAQTPSQPTIANVPLQASTLHVQGDTAPAAILNLPSMADDIDLIEKEWVTKVKDIIRAHKDDPYQQSQLLSQAKSDYMQKRYNKIIKTSS